MSRTNHPAAAQVARSDHGAPVATRRARRPAMWLAALAIAGVIATGIPAPALADAAPAATRPHGFRCAPSSQADLDDPSAVGVARMLVSSAENSSLDWESQVGYLEYDVEHNDAENRGYTGGLIGFTSKSGDMLLLMRRYAGVHPGARLSKFVHAMEKAQHSASREGLGPAFERAWGLAAEDPAFLAAQLEISDRYYLHPAVDAAREDGLGRLGQFIYYDAIVMHGPGMKPGDFGGLRARAQQVARPPSRGGSEAAYLAAFLDVRKAEMGTQQGWHDTSRIDTAQRRFLEQGNLSLTLPLEWEVYTDRYRVADAADAECKAIPGKH